MRHPPYILALSLLAVAAPLATSAATLTLDTMLDAFDPNPCLPVSNQPVIFRGPYCDGASCPPDLLVSGCAGSDLVGQLGLSTILQDGSLSVWRVSHILQTEGWTGTASARLRPELARVDVATTDPGGSMFSLDYGSDSWRLNLNSPSMVDLRVPVAGDISPSQPLYCQVQLLDSSAPGRYATLTLTATAPGMFVFPRAAFFTYNGFDFGSVDYLTVLFLDCPFGSCSVAVPPRSYIVEPITIEVTGVTPAVASSWGRVKTLYR